MSDKMRLISFEKLLTWIKKEYEEKGTIFGVHKNKFYKNESGTSSEIFGDKLATPLGPAAGPNSQLAQNIVTSYLTGSRFIELKTVQIIDGEDLPVAKPCIRAEDECYNCEWSTELRVPEAYDEYVKGWFLLHVLMKELNLSEERDFAYNMSVGYDLEGIKSPKVDAYIEGMRNASKTAIWNECREVLLANMDSFRNFTKEDLDKISPVICNSITESTLHGCPPEEIERIATYMLKEKNLHTFIKMNPTLLGEKFVRDTFDAMGYDYVVLNGHHFENDLQYPDAVAMLKRLKKVAAELNLEIGVKLTNTLPVKVDNDELPSEEMYMSGRSLYPLSITLASRLANEFNGDLQISYSGGIDAFNVDKVLATGIQPLTFATTILKPGGYERITQMAKKIEKDLNGGFKGLNTELLSKLAKDSVTDKYHVKDLRTVESRMIDHELPTYSCATSPCTVGCPINQQIPEYIALVGNKKYDEAFAVIAKDNTAPAITGTICNHNCQYKCTRLDYEKSVAIRDMKKIAAVNAQDKFIENVKVSEIKSGKKVAVIGAGPAGMATALFLRRNGVDVTVMDRKERAYGTIEYVIPEFRIPSEMIKKDFELVKATGVNFKFGVDPNFSIEELKKEYDYVVLAIGTWKPGKVSLKEGADKAINAIAFLETHKAEKGNMDLGKHVCIIGGGNVAMDAARAAKRTAGVETVSIVYRRTKKFMPADNEEIDFAIEDGVEFKELLSPVSIKDGKLICDEMKLGDKDSSGRRSPVATGNTVELNADTVIVAVGEQLDSEILDKNGIALDSKGFAKISTVRETSVENVYVAGDMKKGPATIVKAIADGKAVAKDILAKEGLSNDFEQAILDVSSEELYERRGILTDTFSNEKEAERCLNCGNVCEICVEVCPNRANMYIDVEGDFALSHQIIHLDGMCNECGNCGIFCPYLGGNPYKDKVTCFWTNEDFIDSKNVGFYAVDKNKGIFKVRTESGDIVHYTMGQEDVLSKQMETIIKTFAEKYSYMLEA